MAMRKCLRSVMQRPSGVMASAARRGLATAPQTEFKEGHFSIKDEKYEGRAIYLDSQATTPLDPRVMDAMMPHMTRMYGNPHSRTHVFGWEAEEATEVARKQVADLCGADAKEIIFTSGATESNNASIKGIARFYKSRGKTHIITTRTEHKCVLDSCRILEMEGFDVTYLPVMSNGLIDMAELEAAMRPETGLVSVMFVNNEIGVIQPMKEIGELCRKNKIFFHTDAAQALGKVPIDVNELKIDAMSLSGHKIYGPKGIGGLYVRRRPRVRLEAQINGGGQERGLRSGTLPTPLVVGFGAACEIAAQEMQNDHAWVKHLSERLYNGIASKLECVHVNGCSVNRYPGNMNLSFAWIGKTDKAALEANPILPVLMLPNATFVDVASR